jgi:hypothetical protein
MAGSGIDWGMGKTNIDPATGIRYGVIPANDVGEAWFDQSEPDYGEPSCPKCGSELAECDGGDYRCEHCETTIDANDSEQLYPESPLRHTYDADGYEITQGGDDTDLFITKSPFFTYATFCSPCAPGACHLRNPLRPEDAPDGNKCYCLGHDWFDGEKAPYVVFSVETGERVEK